MKTSPSRQKLWHLLFRVGIVLKTLDGFVETAAAVAFLCINPQNVVHKILSFTQRKLLQDPDDWLAIHLRHGFEHLSTGNKIFVVVYLLGHGLVKLVVAVGLWRDQLWAFPAGLIVLIGFVGYQTFKLVEHFSIGLCVLMLLDIAVIALIWREYRRVKQQKK